MAIEQVVNNVSTVLNGSINNSTTSVVVASATGMPGVGNFRIIVDSEIMKVTARSGTTLTVVRAQEGTAAASHADLAAVDVILTAGSVAAYRGDACQSGVAASRPAAGSTTIGTTYRETDGPLVSRDNGSTLEYFGPIWPVTKHDDSVFSWVRQGTGSTVTANGSMTSLKVTTADSDFSLRTKSKTGNYTLTAGITTHCQGGLAFGLVIRDSTSGKFVFLGNSFNGGLRIFKMNSPTSYSADYSLSFVLNSNNFDLQQRPLVWLRIQATASNLIYSISLDGFNFYSPYTSTRTDFLAADDQIGYGAVATRGDAYMNVISWAEQ